MALNKRKQIPNIIRQLACVAAVMLCVMTMYEWLKQTLIPDISIWESHLITIVFTTLLSVIVFYFILRQFHREYRARIREISRRKASQAALRQSEEKWMGLVNNAMVGVYQAKSNGAFIMVNHKLAQVLGYDDPEQFLSTVQNFKNLYAKPDETDSIAHQFSAHRTIDRMEVELKNKAGQSTWVLLSARAYHTKDDELRYEGFIIDMTTRKRIEADKERLYQDLQKSVSQVKVLSGMLPICASCKKIRDDQGYWNQLESFIQLHSEAQFSHGCCPDCAEELYPGFMKCKSS